MKEGERFCVGPSSESVGFGATLGFASTGRQMGFHVMIPPARGGIVRRTAANNFPEWATPEFKLRPTGTAKIWNPNHGTALGEGG